MSLLKWKEMAKSKSALGKKINFVHNAITQKKLGEETSQIGLEKMFKPITAKLDDVIASNLPHGSLRSLPRAQPARKRKAKPAEIDYLPDVDPFEEMDVEGLFDDKIVPPQPEKQIPEAPPNYEEVLEEIEQSIPDYSLEPEDDEVEPEDDEVIVEGDVNNILDELEITNYQKIDNALEKSTASQEKKKKYLESQIKEAYTKRSRQYNRKSYLKKQVQSGKKTEDEISGEMRQIDVNKKVLNDYMSYYKNKLKSFQGSGVRKRYGRGITFFSNPKELLQKLEVIIGSILAGNTNVGIRNTGVEILDLLLKEGAIKRYQHEKLFKNYFKP